MAGSRSVEYLYRIVDRFSPTLEKMKKVGQRFDAQVTKIQGSLGRMEDKFKTAGAKLSNLQTGLASLGAGAFLKSALDQSVQFGDSIGRIGTLIPGQRERINSLRDTITDMAVQNGKDLNDIAGGAFDVISAFGDMEGETEGRLKAVTQAAIAGGSSTSEALSLLSAVTKSYGDTSAEALTKASDLAFMTNVLGQTTFPEMAASMGKVLPLTSKMAVSQEEVFAAMASLTGVTGNTAEVSTQLAATMSALIKPTDTMKKTVESLGFASVSAMVKERGLSGALGVLADAAGGSEEMVGQLFGSKEAMTAFFALTGAQADKFSESLIAMGQAAQSGGKTTQDALDEMTAVPGHQLRQLTANMQALKVSMGDTLGQALNPLVQKLGPFITNLRTANPQLLKMITYGLMFVTALGAILIPLGLLISSIGSIIGVVRTIIGLTKVWSAVQIAFNAIMSANPIALVILGIAALIAITIVVIKYWDQITAAVKRAWTWFVNFYDTTKGIIAIFGGPMVYSLMAVIDMIRSLITNFDEIKAAFRDGGFLAGILAIGDALIQGLIAPFKSFIDMVFSAAEKLSGFGSKVKGFFGFGGEEVPTAPIPSAAAPIPMGYAANANAEASVSVYTEEGMSAKPFNPRGNLGYNMSSRSRR